MRADLERRALVLGGSGHIGGAVVAELARRGITGTLTYHQNAGRAEALASEHGYRAMSVDLSDAAATAAFLDGTSETHDVVVHAAGVSAPLSLVETDDATLERTLTINGASALRVARHLASRVSSLGDAGADVVFVGALENRQSLPLPVHFAASQGLLQAAVMALGHELGPLGIRVNMITLGVMDGGMSTALASASRRDYERFSSLRRSGTAVEAARAIAWLALENSYIQGRVIPVNGGI